MDALSAPIVPISEDSHIIVVRPGSQAGRIVSTEFSIVGHSHPLVHAALIHNHDDRYNDTVFCDVDVFNAHNHSGVLAPLVHLHHEIGDFSQEGWVKYGNYLHIRPHATDNNVGGGYLARRFDALEGVNWQHIWITGDGFTAEYPLYLRHSSHAGGVYVAVFPNSLAQKPIAASWDTYASSRKWKKDILPIVEPIKKVQTLTGITFKHDKEKPDDPNRDKLDIGVTFEDLEALQLPGVATRNEKGEPEGINLVKVIPVLIEAIKELAARLEILEKKVVTT